MQSDPGAAVHTEPRGSQGARPAAGVSAEVLLQALSNNSEGPDEQTAPKFSAPAWVFTGRENTYPHSSDQQTLKERFMSEARAAGSVSMTCIGPAP